MLFTAVYTCNLFHKQIVRCADGSCVTVSHIYQIILRFNIYYIPHMAAGSGTAGHCTADGKAGRTIGEIGKVAQILERLGVALTHNIGV